MQPGPLLMRHNPHEVHLIMAAMLLANVAMWGMMRASARWLAKLVNGPFVPIAPQLVLFPLPVACQVYYGEPMYFEGDGSEPNHVIRHYIDEVRQSMERLISIGLDARPQAFMFDRMPETREERAVDPGTEARP